LRNKCPDPIVVTAAQFNDADRLALPGSGRREIVDPRDIGWVERLLGVAAAGSKRKLESCLGRLTNPNTPVTTPCKSAGK